MPRIRDAVVILLLATIGWLCLDWLPIALWRLFDLPGEPGRPVWLLIAFVFGGVFTASMRRRWYLAPFVGVAIDALVTAWGLMLDGSTIWPIVLARRIVWMLAVFMGACSVAMSFRLFRWPQSRAAPR
jgi:hypothetical protein